MADTISRKLQQEFEDLPKNWIVMLETSAKNSLNVGIEMLKILIKKGLLAVILSASRPCSNLRQLYAKNNLDLNKIFVLCAVCKPQKNFAKEADNIFHAQSINALTEIYTSLNKITDNFKDNQGFFFIDSISTMLIHNKPRELARFIHSVLIKIRLKNLNGILISLEEETDKEKEEK